MKSKLLICSALVFVVLCFNRCTPEEVQTTQDQFKPLSLKVTLANPIKPLSDALNSLEVEWNYGVQSLNNNIPNQVGMNELILNTTAVPNTPLMISIDYFDFFVVTNYCNTVTVEIEFNGQVIFYQQRDLGGAAVTNCGDGNHWDINFTIP